MEAETTSVKPARKARTLDEEIAHQREKLRKLEERQREQQRREREKNQKAVLELIKAERLDTVPAERWRAVMPKLKVVLAMEPDPGKKPQAETP
ncbi:hypothetical protein C6P61_17135 [Malikia spinosa]|uniref:Mobilization protein n=1 Tax=Malikia spinosa TaxID=86180 RepID=A0A2S9K9Z9_9BURK|nr:hypothetical protein [Malikia spinosa]PRD67293.1 hypothetical protein C6P61_17135 [Malikia spinosa]